MGMISPNDLHKAACDAMLGGKKPTTNEEWALCANFWARNIQKGLEVSCLPLLGLVLECPLDKDYLVAVALFQNGKK